jgi:hypothetical protein
VNDPSRLTEYHLEKRYAQPDEQIDEDRAALLRSCNHHGLHVSDLVKATVDAQRASRDGSIKRDLNAGRCGTLQRTLKGQGIENIQISQ